MIHVIRIIHSKTHLSHFQHYRFFIAEKSVGAKGFKATWTEVKDKGAPCPPEMFKCEHSRFCISPDLVCNGQHNCGQDEHGNKDQSDEKQAFCKPLLNTKVINLHQI